MNPADEAGLTRGEAGSPRALRTPFYVIEQDSPAITRDGRLVESIGIEMPRGTFLHVLEVGAVGVNLEDSTDDSVSPLVDPRIVPSAGSN